MPRATGSGRSIKDGKSKPAATSSSKPRAPRKAPDTNSAASSSRMAIRGEETPEVAGGVQQQYRRLDEILLDIYGTKNRDDILAEMKHRAMPITQDSYSKVLEERFVRETNETLRRYREEAELALRLEVYNEHVKRGCDTAHLLMPLMRLPLYPGEPSWNYVPMPQFAEEKDKNLTG